MNERLPLLIAKQKNARFFKEDYKLGWLFQDATGYLWTVWGCCTTLEGALKVAKQVIAEKGSRAVYLCETPLDKDKAIYEALPTLKEVDI